MSAFLGDLTVTQLSDRAGGSWRLWRLAEDLRYDLGGGTVIVVPTGFITDGPSIPQIFWNILPVWGSWSRAGVIHDFVCCLLAMGRPHEACPTRYDCDRMFADAIWNLRVSFTPWLILYLGVCFGRWFNVRCTMVDYNVKLSAILEQRVKESTPDAVKIAVASPVGGMSPLPLIEDHPHTFAALEANPGAIVVDAVGTAKAQATGRS
jgi:hypothetical protein